MTTNLTGLKSMVETYYANATADYGVEFHGVEVREWNDGTLSVTAHEDGTNTRFVTMPANVYTAEEAFNIWMDFSERVPF